MLVNYKLKADSKAVEIDLKKRRGLIICPNGVKIEGKFKNTIPWVMFSKFTIDGIDILKDNGLLDINFEMSYNDVERYIKINPRNKLKISGVDILILGKFSIPISFEKFKYLKIGDEHFVDNRVDLLEKLIIDGLEGEEFQRGDLLELDIKGLYNIAGEVDVNDSVELIVNNPDMLEANEDGTMTIMKNGTLQVRCELNGVISNEVKIIVGGE